MKKYIINFLYKCIEKIESIEYRNNDLDQLDISKKIINSYNTDEYQVTSDKGLVDISSIHITQPYTQYKLKLKNGLFLRCADNHIVFNSNLSEVFVKDLSIGDELYTENGNSKVISIEKTDIKTSMGDLSIDSEDHRYYTGGILSHNTIIASVYILHYMLFNDTKSVLIAANVLDTSKEVLDKIKTIYTYLPFFLQQGIDVWNVSQIKFKNGCRAKAFAMTKNASIGNTGDLVYIDEFAHINDTVANKFYKSIFPTITSIENSKIIITSTPNGHNLFHDLLTDSEREDTDPLKNNFASMRTYWYEVPGRNVTYFKINEHLLPQYNLTVDMLVEQTKALFDPNNEFTTNKIPFVEMKRDSNSGQKWIRIQNSETLLYEDIAKTEFINTEGDPVHCSNICQVSTWKIDAIKDIGGLDNFNQEYDLRFTAGSKSVLSEITLERLKLNKKPFEHLHSDVFKRLRWDWSSLKFLQDFDEATRKKLRGLISIDISEGLGQDYSVVNMFNLGYKPLSLIDQQKESYQTLSDFHQLLQFGMFRSNVVSHEQLAELVYLLVFEFLEPDNFKLVVEYNNDGKAFLQALKTVFEMNNNYSGYVILKFKHRMDAKERSPGLKVGGFKNKYVKDYQDLMEGQEFIVYHEMNITEIGNFIKHTTSAGNTVYRGDGSNDDCVPPETLITTNDGIKMVKDISIGDYVLTHKGRYKKVINIGNRYSDYLYKVTSNNKMDISLTGNHELFLFEKKNPTNKDKKLKFIDDKKWISIDDGINIDKHYTSFIPNKDIQDIEHIDLYEYCDKDKYMIKDDKLYSIMYENENVINPKQNPIDRYLSVSNDMCYVFGYYLAEGSRNDHQISFACHTSETNLRRKISNIFSDMGLHSFETTKGNSSRITVSSKVLSNFFKIFGKSDSKKLPPICNFLPNSKLRNIINGYLMGDGGFSVKGIRSFSISPSISFFVYESLVKMGYKPSLKVQKQPINKTYIGSKDFGYVVNINDYDKKDILSYISSDLRNDKNIKYNDNVSDSKSYQKSVDGYLIGKIRKIEKIEYNDTVYNIEVEDDNSYVANGIIVHNCAMTMVNMSQGWKHSAFKEIIDEFHESGSNPNMKRIVTEILNNEVRVGTDYNAFFEVKNNPNLVKSKLFGTKINVKNLFS